MSANMEQPIISELLAGTMIAQNPIVASSRRVVNRCPTSHPIDNTLVDLDSSLGIACGTPHGRMGPRVNGPSLLRKMSFLHLDTW